MIVVDRRGKVLFVLYVLPLRQLFGLSDRLNTGAKFLRTGYLRGRVLPRTSSSEVTQGGVKVAPGVLPAYDVCER